MKLWIGIVIGLIAGLIIGGAIMNIQQKKLITGYSNLYYDCREDNFELVDKLGHCIKEVEMFVELTDDWAKMFDEELDKCYALFEEKC